MQLEQQKQLVLNNILACIEDGTGKSESMDKEYHAKRQQGTFNQGHDTPLWLASYSEWYDQCLSMLKDNFQPAIILTNKFKNPPMSPLAIAGENAKWNSLNKNYSARLELLGSLYETVASIKEGELSDFVELTVGVPGIAGAKIKVDKILSRLFK